MRASARASAEWNCAYRKQEQCLALDPALPEDPPVRYADAVEVGAGYAVPRRPSWNPRSTVRSSCAASPGTVRIDLTETVELADPGHPRLYFHKGGQGYDPGTVPYGHVDARVLSDPPGPVFTKDELDEVGAEPRDRHGHGAGRAHPSTVATYRVRPVPIGPGESDAAWLYKDPAQYPGKSLSGARYSKYGEAGPTQGARDESFAYLCWSWVRQSGVDGDRRDEVRGGGAVRALLRPDQLVHRCDVEPVTAPAWNRAGEEVGQVVAVYVRVPVLGTDLYGWIVHSHLERSGSGLLRTMHVDHV